MPGQLLTERPTPDIVRLKLSQPGKKNAIDATIREELRHQLNAISVDLSVRALIITGDQGDFSSGGDIESLLATPIAAFRDRLSAGHSLIRTLYRMPKPVVAAINGVAAGGGTGLALCCDEIVMGRTARIGFNFIGIGFVPDWGLLHTLPARIGHGPASRWFMHGRLVSADEAETSGLADVVVANEDVQDVALSRALALAARAPQAFARTKLMMRPLEALDAILALELEAQADCFEGPEFREGATAFLEKRRPVF